MLKSYFPCLTIRESECRALAALAEPTKDSIFPIVKIQAWPRQKVGAGSPVERSVENILESFGSRMFGVDLADPRSDLTSSWGLQGREEIARLRSSANGYEEWCNLVSSVATFVPTVIWSGDIAALRSQVERLAALGRGLILRFRRSQGWNLTQLALLRGIPFQGVPLLLVFDNEQITRSEDLTLVGLSCQSAILAVANLLGNQQADYVLVASSFPSSFADIDPSYAKLDIRERQLFDMIRTSPQLVQLGLSLQYGDHASVYAADREPAFKGAPRIDYPAARHWIYYRRPSGFANALTDLLADPDWDDQLLCWGAQRIRSAAAGNMTGLGSQGPWVTIRLNIHMHQQAHFESGSSNPIDEDWVD